MQENLEKRKSWSLLCEWIESKPAYMRMIEERDQLVYWKIRGENMSWKQHLKLKIYNALVKPITMRHKSGLPKDVKWAMRQFRVLKATHKIRKFFRL
jgi:hypothetical protein